MQASANYLQTMSILVPQRRNANVFTQFGHISIQMKYSIKIFSNLENWLSRCFVVSNFCTHIKVRILITKISIPMNF